MNVTGQSLHPTGVWLLSGAFKEYLITLLLCDSTTCKRIFRFYSEVIQSESILEQCIVQLATECYIVTQNRR